MMDDYREVFAALKVGVVLPATLNWLVYLKRFQVGQNPGF
jgi:hypothetical protein